jgi:hypothetical protein
LIGANSVVFWHAALSSGSSLIALLNSRPSVRFFDQRAVIIEEQALDATRFVGVQVAQEEDQSRRAFVARCDDARCSRKREPKRTPSLRSIQPPRPINRESEQQFNAVRHHDRRSRWCAVEGQQRVRVKLVADGRGAAPLRFASRYARRALALMAASSTSGAGLVGTATAVADEAARIGPHDAPARARASRRGLC